MATPGLPLNPPLVSWSCREEAGSALALSKVIIVKGDVVHDLEI